MACFYCSYVGVVALDIGQCVDCHKHVCSRATCPRPQFHAEVCGCGCADILCIYHMSAHAKNAHQSSDAVCFANTALSISITAASAIEQIPNLREQETRHALAECLRRYAQFTVGVPPERPERAEIGAAPALQLEHAAALLPSIARRVVTAGRTLLSREEDVEWLPHDARLRVWAAVEEADRGDEKTVLDAAAWTTVLSLISPRLAILQAAHDRYTSRSLVRGDLLALALGKSFPGPRWSVEQAFSVAKEFAEQPATLPFSALVGSGVAARNDGFLTT